MQVGSYDPNATLHKFLTLVVIQISCMMSTWLNFLEWTLHLFLLVNEHHSIFNVVDGCRNGDGLQQLLLCGRSSITKAVF